jgi:hypothetical protein
VSSEKREDQESEIDCWTLKRRNVRENKRKMKNGRIK